MTSAWPECERVKVWRKLLDVIQRNDRFRNKSDVVIRTYSGKPGDKRAPAYGKGVTITLRRGGGVAEWVSADAHIEPLIIDAEILVSGTDHDLIDNVWAAVVRALYPKDDNAASVRIGQELIAAGAETGIVEYTTAVLVDPEANADSGQLRARAQLRLNVLVQT